MLKCDHRYGSSSPVSAALRDSLDPVVAGLFEILHDQMLLATHSVSFLIWLPLLRSCLRSSILPGSGCWQDGIAWASLGTGCPGAELEPEDGLEAPAEVFVAEAVDDGVDAAVEEGQPVGEGVNVDVDEL